MLEVRNVSKKYLKRYAVEDTTFRLEDGKTCLLLGPNGSGKTTLMKMIAGLAQPTSGDILLNDELIGTATKAHIAYMPTENYFYNYMTLKDAGKYYQDFFKDFDIDRYNRLLENMELSASDKIRQLSSGMAAKLRLALILSRKAHIMMFDEPLNGVDILTRQQVVDAILESRKQKCTMIISTHLVDELDEVVDYVIFLKNGKVALQGECGEVCNGRSLKELYLEIYGNQSLMPFVNKEGE